MARSAVPPTRSPSVCCYPIRRALRSSCLALRLPTDSTRSRYTFNEKIAKYYGVKQPFIKECSGKREDVLDMVLIFEVSIACDSHWSSPLNFASPGLGGSTVPVR